MLRQLAAALAAVLISAAAYGQASLVPDAKQQFFDASGNPLASGTVDLYVPNTGTRKNSWTNSTETSLNTNPIVLDSAGRAVIYGQGTYRQVVKDATGNTQWDAVTAAPSSGTSTFLTDAAPVGTLLPYSGLALPTNYLWAGGQEVLRSQYATLMSAITYQQSVTSTSSSTTLGGFTSTAQFHIGIFVEGSCLDSGTTITAIPTATSVTISAAATSTGACTVTVFPHGNGNGLTTFNIPNMRGRVPAGADNLGGTAAGHLTSTYCAAGGGPVTLGVQCGAQSNTMTLGQLVAHTHTSPALTDPGHIHTYGGALAGGSTGANFNAVTTTSTALNTGSSTTGITLAANTGSAGSTTPFPLVQPTTVMNYIIKYQQSSPGGAGGVVSLGGMTGDITCGTGVLCANNTVSFTGGGGSGGGFAVFVPWASGNQQAAIQNGINTCVQSFPVFGCKVILDAKSYRVDSTITLNNGITLIGQGSDATTLDFSNQVAGVGILMPGLIDAGVQDLKISKPFSHGIYVAGSEAAVPNSINIRLWNLSIGQAAAGFGSQTGSGVMLGTVITVSIKNVISQYNAVHGFATLGPGSLVNNTTFDTTYALFNGVNGYSLANILDSTLTGVASDFNGGYGYALQQAAGISFNGPESESNPSGMFAFVASTAVGTAYDVQGIVISGCFSFRNGTATTQPSLIQATSSNSRPITVTVSGCVEQDDRGTLPTNSVLASGTVVVNKLSGSFAFAQALSGGAAVYNAVYDTLAQTLTGKSMSGASNTFTAIPNSALTNPATTVNGQTCTLGSTCTVSASATSVTVGTTTVASGTTTRVLFDNAGVLGEYTNAQLTNLIAVTSPITNAASSIACATCVTSAAALTANSLVIGSGSQASAVTTTGTGVLTALGVNVGSAGAFVTFNGAGGTPSSITLTNATGLPAATGLTGQVPFANGGTAASLTASNGGILYSTASAGAILSGTATARQMLQSGASTTPAWSTTTWPATTTINRILWSSAANVISDLATANSSILVTDGGGIPSLSTTVPALTLGGTVSGGGNQINNVIVGTVTPLAVFSTITYATGALSTLKANSITMDVAGGTQPRLSGFGTNTSTMGSLSFSLFSSDASLGLSAMSFAATSALSDTVVAVNATTDATSTTSAAFKVAGGAAIRKRVFMDGLTTSAAIQTAVLCQSSAGEVIADSVACLASSARFKNIIDVMEDGALAKLVALPLHRWSYKPEGIFHNDVEHVGPIAEDVAAMDPRLAGYDSDGNVRTYSTEQLLAVTIKAVQELKAANDNLKEEVQQLKAASR